MDLTLTPVTGLALVTLCTARHPQRNPQAAQRSRCRTRPAARLSLPCAAARPNTGFLDSAATKWRRSARAHLPSLVSLARGWPKSL